MTRRLPSTDVVVVGLGWTGSIMSLELARAGLGVVAIERGPWRDTATDFPPATSADELRYAIRQDLFLRPAQETLTFRNTMAQTALPIRRWGSFLPGNGVGGAGCIGTATPGAGIPGTSPIAARRSSAMARISCRPTI